MNTQSVTKEKVYEVRVNGKIHWIAAKSKKAIREFFHNPRPTSIIVRLDARADLCPFYI